MGKREDGLVIRPNYIVLDSCEYLDGRLPFKTLGSRSCEITLEAQQVSKSSHQLGERA